MYIYIGGDTVLRSRDIVAIFDAAILQYQSDLTQRPNWLALGPVKSVVLTPTRIYGSPISCATLRRRLSKPADLDTET